MNLFAWRKAIAKSQIEASTKLVLYTLSNYMHDNENSCYPSTDTLMEECSLSKRAIIMHLEKAVSSGLLEKSLNGYSGQGWRKNKYTAILPKGGANNDTNNDKRGANKSSKSSEGGAENSTKIEKGGANNDKKVVQQMHLNNPLEKSIPMIDDCGGRAKEIFAWLESHFNNPKPYSPSPIHSWLQWGADFELDIKPCAVRYSKTREPPRALSWLDDAIANSIKQRNKPMPEVEEYEKTKRNQSGAVATSSPGNRSPGSGDKPTWKSEGERIAAAYLSGEKQ